MHIASESTQPADSTHIAHGPVVHLEANTSTDATFELGDVIGATTVSWDDFRNGVTGVDVQTLQERLVELGARIAIDGCFNDETEAAVRGFQMRTWLTVDGIVGPRTLAALGLRANAS